MASKEGEKPSFAERTGETVRNAGIVTALIGTVLWLARQSIGATLFEAGVIAGVAGEAGKRLGKKK